MYQFSEFTWQYPITGKDGVLGNIDPRLIGGDNAFGIDPNDPNGQDDVLVEDSEVHIPSGKPIKVFNHGDMMRDFTYIDDIVQGVKASLFFDGLDPHEIPNRGNKQPERFSLPRDH